MEELEKSIYINKLYDLYGALLSSSQNKMISLYYSMDLSLSEIAAQEGISRNAVYDAIKKGIVSLKEYEEKLHLLERKTIFEGKLELLKSQFNEDEYERIVHILKGDN